MIQEAYVSLEVAKLLKEKGFNEYVMKWYVIEDDGSINKVASHSYSHSRNSSFKNYEIGMPTQQMAMRWLREVHNLFITIEIKGDPRMESFIYYKWSVAKYNSCQIKRLDNGLHTPEDYWYAKDEEDETYEAACEAAIRYCLGNLL